MIGSHKTREFIGQRAEEGQNTTALKVMVVSLGLGDQESKLIWDGWENELVRWALTPPVGGWSPSSCGLKMPLWIHTGLRITTYLIEGNIHLEHHYFR